ncbi:kelch-like protein 20 [Adelges cooleyi]|uniref:kelch-like protein 20 n=1 Tax=Adelges cooleyi TaxID=133065 RepID=UPI00217FA42C|nr:kelch-like protein 20 [Adelges cooleyi]
MEVSMQKHFERMYQFYKDKELCDITLVTNEGLKIEAHRNILASASHVFYTMFIGKFRERVENEILIKEIDSEILELVVKFAYTFKLDIKENNCVVENMQYTIVNSDKALETLYDFEFDDVVVFIAHDNLVIDSEEKVFDFIIGWIRYNIDERNDLLSVLMKYLRLPLISKKRLQRIYDEPLVRNNNDEHYDFEQKHWEQLDPMPICNYGMGISRKDRVIYLIGGFNAPRRVFKFDLQHFKWDEIPKMMNMECDEDCSGVGVMKNDLFVFANNGGRLHYERYDRGKNQWQLFNRVRTSSSPTSHIITFNDIFLKSCGIQL